MKLANVTRNHSRGRRAFVAALKGCVAWLVAASVVAQVAINEVMYHPVEEPAFNADGSPVLDLYEDVHEFIELHNPGSESVSLAGWEFSGGIRYAFPSNAVLQAGSYLVVAKHPARLEAVSVYRLPVGSVLGPYDGQLGNRNDTVHLRDAAGGLVDAVTYSAEFPWAISADGLGADEEWTGLRPMDYQYRGRSLERVSLTHPANDPANWLASPIPGEPSPGRANAVRREVPQPVVINFMVSQQSDEASLIRQNEPVRMACGFSSTRDLSGVRVEWFVDQIDRTNETTQVIGMEQEGAANAARFTAILPGQPNRTVVRFRFRANRGSGDEVVSPRSDDPYRWHAYFVTPVRTSSRPVYDCFISSPSLTILGTNISQSPRRVVSPDPPGRPRASWNATQPAIMVHEGVVYDIRMRHHGSRYNRNAGRNSFKWQFPRYRKFNGVTGIFETDKGNDFIVGHGLFRAIGHPVSAVRYVDLYLNNNGVMQRLEQGEFDGDMLEEYHRNQQALNPGSELEPPGEIYKTVGTIDMPGEGPYGRGDGRQLSKPPHWTDLQMYEWTFALQNHGWRGSYYWKQMIDAFWVARGDSPNRLNPNVPALRTFFTNYFDIDQMLTLVAVENWCCPWDHTTQNHFFWQRRNGKWGMLPWDNDAWYGRGDNTPANASIFIGEVGDPNNNFRGPNFFKDAFIKAFRSELKERFFLLNNTFLHPDNLRAMGFGSIASFAQQRMASVNQQCGLGVFQRPGKPVGHSPSGGATALAPARLTASAYNHSATPPSPHATTTWEIRSASGTYLAPLWKVTTSNDLTSIAIPFEQLRFGEAFYWRCTYTDARGHPSVTSDEAAFNFGPAAAERAVLPIDEATTWRYDQSGQDWSASNWTALDFDDSAWAMGAGLFAREEAALPEAIRTPLTIGKTTYYFRKRFTLPGSTQGASVRLSTVVDDGCIIHINGKEWQRLRMPGGTVTYATFASQNVGDAVYEGPVEVPASLLQSGDNVIAVEVHQSNANSSDVVFGLSLHATFAAASGAVVLNEIGALNTASVTNEGRTPDWIELYNNGSQTVDLAGFSLTDDVLRPRRFVFPPRTLIAARGFLTVWCDDRTNAPGHHTGFALSDRGQTVAWLGPPAEAGAADVLDYIAYGPQAADYAIGRATDGAGDWRLTVPTPGRPNQVQALAPATGNLCINEWMAAPDTGDDWVELHNRAALPVAVGGFFMTDDLTRPANSRLAALSFVGPSGFLKLAADGNPEGGPDHLGFRLSAGGEAIGLFGTNGTVAIDSVQFALQQTGVSEGRLPDGADRIVSFPTTSSPGDPNHLPLTNVVINEVLAHSDPPLEDAIELRNITSAPVDIGHWWLSDRRQEPRKFQIPAGTILPPDGFVVFYEYQFNSDTNAPSSFALSSARGDEVVLSAADAGGRLSGYRTKVDFEATEQGVSQGRYPTSQGHDFTALDRRTFGVDGPTNVTEFRKGPGLANSGPRMGPLVISEIMFRPSTLGTNDNQRDEFIELYNPGDQPVALFDPAFPDHTWELRGGVRFVFPPAVTLPPRSALIVVSFDPQTNAVARAEFETVYGSTDRALHGPYEGKLGNGGDVVRLYKPDVPEPLLGSDPGFVPYILVERVEYSPRAPWPEGADGTGSSLVRLDLAGYGNEPQNWQAASPTPGRVEGGAPSMWRLAIEWQPSESIRIRAQGNGSARLQVSTDLMNWIPVDEAVQTSDGLEYLERVAVGAPARYFRVVRIP